MPAFIMFVLYSNMPKEQWRANMAAIQVISLSIKAYWLLIANGLWENKLWPQYLTVVVVSLSTVPVGNLLASRINQVQFRQLVFVILFGGSLNLATHNTGLASLAVVSCLAVGAFLCLLLSWCSGLLFLEHASEPMEATETSDQHFASTVV